MRILFVMLMVIGASTAHRVALAQGQNIQPAYMSLKSSEVHMRVGPGKMYPIIWTYTARGLPLQVLARHQDWFQVRDIDGETGWMFGRLLSTARTALVTGNNVSLFHHPDNASGLVAQLLPHVVVSPITCRTNWCRVSVTHQGNTLKGWMLRKYLWGIQPSDFHEG